MSIKYNVIGRGNPANREAPEKYYPSVVSDGASELRDIAKLAAEVSTVSVADTMAVIESLLVVIPREIANGRVVKLGDFGSFWIKLKTHPGETPPEVTSRNIDGVIPRFTPGKEFKANLQNLTFEKK